MIVLRPADALDVDACVAVQRASTAVGYAHIFDAALYPFPEDSIRQEWVTRLTSSTAVTIACSGQAAVGVIGTSGNRLEALFVVPEHWGLGVADQLHEHALAEIANAGHRQAALDVLADNARARAFYERRGWTVGGETTTAPWPPYPDLVSYRRSV